MNNHGYNPKPFMNPYVAGILLGLVLLATIYITGRGLGASGGVKSFIMWGVKNVFPQHYANTPFYQEFNATHPGNPLNSWLFFEVLGVMAGAFFSGVLSDRVAIRLEKGPQIKTWSRVLFAAIGGFLFGLGSQLGRGCTSGAALSGLAVMSLGGILTMFAIFGGGYLLAYFFRKLWL